MKRRGFTLLEILVVMAIIGILAAIGIGSYGGVQSKARDARRKNDLASIARALEMYRGDFDAYSPMSAAPPCSGGCQMTLGPWGSAFQANNQIYMPEVPRDPRGTTYEYYAGMITMTGSVPRPYFYLFARLENMEDSGDRVARLVGGESARWQLPSAVPGGPFIPTCGSSDQGCNYYISSPNAPVPTAVAFP